MPLLTVFNKTSCVMCIEYCHSEVPSLLQDDAVRQVQQASLDKLVLLGTLVIRASLDLKVLLELQDLKDRLGKLETKVCKDQLGQ